MCQTGAKQKQTVPFFSLVCVCHSTASVMTRRPLSAVVLSLTVPHVYVPYVFPFASRVVLLSAQVLKELFPGSNNQRRGG